MNPPQQSKAAQQRLAIGDKICFWLIGWHRAAIRRLLDDALQETDAQTVKALMRHKEAALRLDETNKNPTP